MIQRSMICCLAAIFVLVAPPAPGRAEDFRIESKVFAGKDDTPVSQSTTLFQAGRVYDYLTDPASVAVFDKPQEKFVLVDPIRRLKTEVTTAELLAFTARLHTWAAKQKKPLLIFAANPAFEIEFKDKQNALTLKSDHLSYRLVTAKAHSEQASQQYREFSDWYARLNAMTNPGSTPPFPRLALNDELAKRVLVAEKVSLTIESQSKISPRAVELRSEHQIFWRLLQKDLKRIAETAEQLSTFKSVSYSEFRRGEAVARR